VAVPLAFAVPETWRERLLWWPALSAGAILIERCTPVRHRDDAPPLYFEDAEKIHKERPDVLLRAEKSTTTKHL